MNPPEHSAAPDDQTPWLSLVGIGEDGLDGLGKSALEAIAGAEMFIGGERHLAFIPEDGRPKIPWPSPLQDLIGRISDYRGKKVCVLATGDPFFFGIGPSLAEKVPASEMRVFPAPSSVSLAHSRMGWSQATTGVVSLHGRPLRSILPWLMDGARLVILTENRNSPGEIAALLEAEGFGESRLSVFSRLGGAGETRVDRTARELAALSGGNSAPGVDEESGTDEIGDLNLIAAELSAGENATRNQLLPGLEDDRFRHDGQITKREIRILTLAALMPKPGDLIWDVGAGSGSISIEWLRTDPTLQAAAIEKSAARRENIRANMEALGAPGLHVVEGEAPACLADLPAPDAVFIGGGLREQELIEACWSRLKPGGRLVANAVTLEGEASLLAFFNSRGGNLTRLQASRAHPMGRLHGWRPETPITQLRIVKAFSATERL